MKEKRNKPPRKQFLIPALTLTLASLALGIGGTAAYFTSVQKNEATVTLGTVKLTNQIESSTFQYYSFGSEEPQTSFASGGTASLAQDGSLSLTNMCPGDKFAFDSVLKNSSTMNINYRVSLAKKDGSDPSPFVLEGDSASGTMTTDEKEKTLHLSIALPGEVEDTALMGQQVVFVLKVEAIQGNVSFEEAE
ncbi:MAG: SipW-dependent-type signal peptide-containing protein [Eubacteriales bacterium]|nr:SipW-dependent-type signal peptide-containing protein [Eubacteriales bacterium]